MHELRYGICCHAVLEKSRLVCTERQTIFKRHCYGWCALQVRVYVAVGNLQAGTGAGELIGANILAAPGLDEYCG